MKHTRRITTGLAAAALLAALLVTPGCKLLGNGKMDILTPYMAGQAFVFFDEATKPIQKTEVKTAIATFYALLDAEMTDLPTDMVIQSLIDRHYTDASPEFREVLFRMYKNLTLQLANQIKLNPGLAESAVLAEFKQGVDDAVALYSAGEVPESPADLPEAPPAG
jgi:hypothetical protein